MWVVVVRYYHAILCNCQSGSYHHIADSDPAEHAPRKVMRATTRREAAVANYCLLVWVDFVTVVGLKLLLLRLLLLC